MDIPTWEILEKAVLKKHILTILQPDQDRAEISLYAFPLLVRSQSLRYIEGITYDGTTVGCGIRIPHVAFCIGESALQKLLPLGWRHLLLLDLTP